MLASRFYTLTALAAITSIACSAPREPAGPPEAGIAGHRNLAQAHQGQAIGEEARDPYAAGPQVGLADGPTATGRTRVAESAALSAAAQAYAHRKHARQHISTAKALQAFEFGACLEVPAHDRTTCPITEASMNTIRIDRGIRIIPLNPADSKSLAAHIRCHHAFGKANGFTGMTSCALYVDDIIIRDGPAGSVDVIGKTPAATRLLWQRVADQQSPVEH